MVCVHPWCVYITVYITGDVLPGIHSGLSEVGCNAHSLACLYAAALLAAT